MRSRCFSGIITRFQRIPEVHDMDAEHLNSISNKLDDLNTRVGELRRYL